MIKKVYVSLELIVNICVLGKMKIAALISIENLISSTALLRYSCIDKSQFKSVKLLKCKKYDGCPVSGKVSFLLSLQGRNLLQCKKGDCCPVSGKV